MITPKTGLRQHRPKSPASSAPDPAETRTSSLKTAHVAMSPPAAAQQPSAYTGKVPPSVVSPPQGGLPAAAPWAPDDVASMSVARASLISVLTWFDAEDALAARFFGESENPYALACAHTKYGCVARSPWLLPGGQPENAQGVLPGGQPENAKLLDGADDIPDPWSPTPGGIMYSPPQGGFTIAPSHTLSTPFHRRIGLVCLQSTLPRRGVPGLRQTLPAWGAECY